MATLREIAKEYDIAITEDNMSQFETYYNMLIEWNSRFNLTAITDKQDAMIKHFLDSILLIKAIPYNPDVTPTLIDVGSGAGFPGIPVKLVRSDIDVTLLDSLKKRTAFLSEAGMELGISKGYAVIHGRAEDLGKRPSHRETYDIACARAVAPLQMLTEYCLPFVKIGGIFLAMKGAAAKDEIATAKDGISLLGGEVAEVKEYRLPDNSERAVVIIKKISQTPLKYPRKPNRIAKTPV